MKEEEPIKIINPLLRIGLILIFPFLIFFIIIHSAVVSRKESKKSIDDFEPIIGTPDEVKLDKKKRYLQISLDKMTTDLPQFDRVIIGADSSLINRLGSVAVSKIRWLAPHSYIIADNKCSDLALREVEIMAEAGANATTCLGIAPVETIDLFIKECQRLNIDSIIDMTNVESPIEILRKLKNVPDIVVLDRINRQIPYYQINQIKGSYDIMVAVTGGETMRDIQSMILNNADIVIVQESFYSSQSDELINTFLKKIK